MRRRLRAGALVALGLLAGAPARADEAACDSADTTVTTFPVPPQSALAYRRAETIAAAASQRRGVEVVLLGDSLTQLWPDASVRDTFGADVLNLGVGSDRTQNVLWRLQDARYAALAPRTVFLMLGTNNLGYGDKVCAIREGLRRVLERLDAVWGKPRLVVVGILPRGRKSAFRDAERLRLNAEWATLLAERGNAVIVDGAELALRCDEDPCPAFAPDTVHLAPPGYAALGAAIRRQWDAPGTP
ncbi:MULTISPECIES: GDSL-type esterase/lipase family protein [unclassified Methylobacterium]|uniref:GDSL-type esterase/lipase family protein n=1 Tax=unclassified Methylobacterium TaxID=2615210 RepID=UPI0009E7AE6D|nr:MULTISPECIES: GDSL-type esterase/lipase family protein [unclassified Methylobacterium]USU34163.1 GDSL-type esterase/lipase family protein [Methylobacterium sp. OTU13CASTA1]